MTREDTKAHIKGLDPLKLGVWLFATWYDGWDEKIILVAHIFYGRYGGNKSPLVGNDVWRVRVTQPSMSQPLVTHNKECDTCTYHSTEKEKKLGQTRKRSPMRQNELRQWISTRRPWDLNVTFHTDFMNKTIEQSSIGSPSCHQLIVCQVKDGEAKQSLEKSVLWSYLRSRMSRSTWGWVSSSWSWSRAGASCPEAGSRGRRGHSDRSCPWQPGRGPG